MRLYCPLRNEAWCRVRGKGKGAALLRAGVPHEPLSLYERDGGLLPAPVLGLRKREIPDREERRTVKIIERVPEHYEVEEVEEFGRVYRWCPESVVVECDDCGKRSTLKRKDLISSVTACECGADDTFGIREGLLLLQQLDEDEATHEAARRPWRYWYSSKDTGIPF